MNKIGFVLCLLLSVACGDSETSRTEHHLSGSEIALPEEAALNYSSMLLDEKGSSLLKAELLGDIALKKICYERDSVVNLLRRGRGPNEYLMLRLQQIDSAGNFYALGSTAKTAHRFAADGTLLETIRFDPGVLSMVRLGDRFVAYGSEEAMYCLTDLSGKVLLSFGEFPDDGFSYDGRYKAMAYQGKMLARPGSNRFAFLCSAANVFEIFEIGENDTPRPVYSLRADLPDYLLQERVIGVVYERYANYYSDAYATSGCIYALYSGKVLDASLSAESVRRLSESDRIRVCDWDGTHRCDLLLDRPVLSFCVSADDRTMIALYSDDGLMRFCKFDLPEVNGAANLRK